jgi:hypothetical protein
MSSSEASNFKIEQMLAEFFRTYLFNSVEPYRDPKSLARYGGKVYSQNDEDGIIAEIFRRIGVTSRFFVEFGVGNGIENNTLALLVQGWKGAWIEGNPANCEIIGQVLSRYLNDTSLSAVQAFITAENVVSLFETLTVPVEFDLLSIDIDFNDYWVWKALSNFRPRVVVIEYNAAFGPSMEWKVPYIAERTWDNSRNFGASLKSYELLGREKGYCLVGCNLTGANAFFIRDDLVADHFRSPFTSEAHFESPKYYLNFPKGHPISVDEVLQRP